MRTLGSLLFCFLAVLCYGQEQRYVTVQRSMNLMGSQFEITVVAVNEEIGYINIEEAAAEIKRINGIISSWNKDSETFLINKNAGIKPVKVSLELYKLIERCKQISEITNGAFDISYASMDQVWKFDGSMRNRPSAMEIKKSISKVGYKNIILDEMQHTVFLKGKGMKIGFGAIGKGYAADKAKELLVSKQVKAGMINASGDLSTWGTKSSGEKWIIGIANPLSKGKIFSWIPIVESSVATSVNYEKYVTFNGKKYSHIIDPRTGYPSTWVNSVTVFGKRAELCDALATAVLIMGTDAGLALINQLRGTEAVVVDNGNKTHKSKGILLDN